MVRSVLLCIHAFCALGLAWSVVMGPERIGPVAMLPMLLLLGVIGGLIARSRWVIVPSVILAMLAATLAGMLLVGAAPWARGSVGQLLVACAVFAGLQGVVIVLGFRRFGRDDSPAKG
jgi:hypothetical protein